MKIGVWVYVYVPSGWRTRQFANFLPNSQTVCLVRKLETSSRTGHFCRTQHIFPVKCLSKRALWVLPKSFYRSQAHFEYLTEEEKKSAHKSTLNEHFQCACRTFYPFLILHCHLCILNSVSKLFFLWSWTPVGADCYDISVEQSTQVIRLQWLYYRCSCSYNFNLIHLIP